MIYGRRVLLSFLELSIITFSCSFEIIGTFGKDNPSSGAAGKPSRFAAREPLFRPAAVRRLLVINLVLL